MVQISNEPRSKYSYLNEWLTLERERVSFFLPEYPCPFGKSVCAELLFGSVLVHIISFECPLKKIIQKKRKKKRERSKRKEEKGADLRDFSFTSGGVLCSPLCPGSRL